MTSLTRPANPLNGISHRAVCSLWSLWTLILVITFVDDRVNDLTSLFTFASLTRQHTSVLKRSSWRLTGVSNLAFSCSLGYNVSVKKSLTVSLTMLSVLCYRYCVRPVIIGYCAYVAYLEKRIFCFDRLVVALSGGVWVASILLFYICNDRIKQQLSCGQLWHLTQ